MGNEKRDEVRRSNHSSEHGDLCVCVERTKGFGEYAVVRAFIGEMRVYDTG